MKYTQAEINKIHTNLDAIKSYIEREIQPRITSRIQVDFGEMKTYGFADREREFHLYVYQDGIRGRIGGLGISFEKNPVDIYEPTAYRHLDFAVALLKNWNSIKATLHTSIERENATREMINNFHV